MHAMWCACSLGRRLPQSQFPASAGTLSPPAGTCTAPHFRERPALSCKPTSWEPASPLPVFRRAPRTRSPTKTASPRPLTSAIVHSLLPLRLPDTSAVLGAPPSLWGAPPLLVTPLS